MAKEPRENEVKFCVFDLMKIASCLRELKARLFLPRTFEVNLRFDVPTGDLKRTGRVLRLRRDKLARLTYKDNSQNIQGALTRREIEFVVDDFESARQFIEALGYQVAFLYEKYRTTYEYKRTHIMLDELPYGNFVEIEGELEMLRPIANELHLDWDKAIPASYHALFERLQQTHGLHFRAGLVDRMRGLVHALVQIMIVQTTDNLPVFIGV